MPMSKKPQKGKKRSPRTSEEEENIPPIDIQYNPDISNTFQILIPSELFIFLFCIISSRASAGARGNCRGKMCSNSERNRFYEKLHTTSISSRTN